MVEGCLGSRILVEEMLMVGWSTNLYSAASVLSVYCGRREGPGFYVYPFLPPFSVSYVFVCIMGFIERDTMVLVLYCLVVWFWSGFCCIERNETERAAEQNMAREDDERRERERLVHYHAIPYPSHTPYPIPITPTLQNTDRRNENGKFLVCCPWWRELCSAPKVREVSLSE